MRPPAKRNSRPQKRKFDASSEIVTLAPVVAKVKVPVKVTIIVFNIKTNMLAFEIFLVENYKSNCYSKDCQLLKSYHFTNISKF